MQQVEDVRHLVISADTRQQPHLQTHKFIKPQESHQIRTTGSCFVCVSGRDQQAEVLSWSQVGVAKVTGSLEDSDDTLHVTGEAEAVMSHDQQLHN